LDETRTVHAGEVVGIASDRRDLWTARDGKLLSRLDGETGQEKSSFLLGVRPLFDSSRAR
jgi:hypothetical protein